MRISTKTRYGVNAMFELASHFGEGTMTIKSIAEAQQIPDAYLEQLMNQLRKANLVKSSRGSQGGYELDRPPREISIGQVINAVEGPMALVGCLTDDDDQHCEREHCCPGRLIWSKISDNISNTVNKMSLQDLLEQCKLRDSKDDAP